MNRTQSNKLFSVTPPAAIIDNASATTAIIDTAGFRRLQVIVYFGAMDIAVTAMKLQESDDSGMSGAADISGQDFTGAYPSATDDNKFFVFDVDLNGRKRYIDLVLTLGDGVSGTYVAVLAQLDRGEAVPSTDTQRGLANALP